MNRYYMSFEEAQDYVSKRGFDFPWNDCEVFVDEREIMRTVGNILKWADEHPLSYFFSIVKKMREAQIEKEESDQGYRAIPHICILEKKDRLESEVDEYLKKMEE